MNQINGPALVIDDGGVAALVTCCLAGEPSRLTPFIASGSAEDAESRADAVKRKADLLGLATPVERSSGEASDDPRIETTALLLDAGREALRLGLSTIVWPVHLGIDLDAMERALDRARLVERLVTLDSPPGAELRIETPLLDLSDAQIAELARDLDAPLETAWWCRKSGPAPCGRCGSCRRWEAVLGPQKAVGSGRQSG